MSAWKSHHEPALKPTGDAMCVTADPRVDLVAQVLSGPSGTPLSDRDHALIRSMHANLIARIEDALRDRMMPNIDREAHPALAITVETRRVRIAGPLIDRTRITADAGLVRAILRRMDEDRLARRMRALREPGVSHADPFIEHGDQAISNPAVALLMAESRRFDRFGEPQLTEGDVAPDTRHLLVWTVAAAIAYYMNEQHAVSAVEADRLVGDAAREWLAMVPPGGSDEAAVALADMLGRRALLDDRVIVNALAGGRIALFAAALARRAGVSADHCWSIVSAVPDMRLLVLLHAAELSRDAVLQIVALMADVPAALADGHAALDPGSATETARRWRMDPAYRDALHRIARNRLP